MRCWINTIAFVLLLAFAGCQQGTGNRKVNLTATEVKQLIEAEEDLVILDVRTPYEFQEGHLEGAVNIDYTSPDFEQEIVSLDTAATYLLYCKSGNRSGRATAVMKNNDFNNLYNATAGFDALKAAGIQTK
ncbi:rhodanese-like domain-containing protein [Pontibacter qinzhouensis]|uniref:Rhodanese-like domain-containing protein n=1 Tax=Pontibacter qinzhouensis TaxID=2603253 RepID=A0A5C8K594_9BACT|nr:rhodanese-like domain-containing protein [Pontibacter qinzhouensis]TXK45832.1 rhodanese-like domain-containing protein [Pontibacter qinzhouensis]